MPEGLIQTITTLVVAGLAALGTWAAKRTPEVGAREHQLIDQLQELTADLRTALAESQAREQAAQERERAAQERERAAQTRERTLLDYAARLRLHIEEGHGPPAPDWPEGL